MCIACRQASVNRWKEKKYALASTKTIFKIVCLRLTVMPPPPVHFIMFGGLKFRFCNVFRGLEMVSDK